MSDTTALEPTPAPEPEELVLEEDAPKPESDDDGMDELEVASEKFRVPKPVKAFVDGVHAKTQTEREALKAERAQIEAEKAKAAESSKLQTALFEEIAELKGIDKQLEPYLKLTPQDWMAWAEQDPDAARKAQIAVTALQTQRGKVFQSAQAKGQELAEQGRKTQAEQAAAMEKELLAKIPNWTPERAKTVEKAVAEAGLPIDALGPWLKNPAVISFVEDALAARAARERARVAREAAAKAAKEQQSEPEPTPRVKANGGSSNIPRDSDAPDVWLKKREAQLRAARR